MKIRPVDSNDDMIPLYNLEQMDTGAQALAQIIRDNLTLLKGEWWEDSELGIDIPGFILDNAKLQEVSMLQGYLSSYILGIEGVDELQDVFVDVEDKQMNYNAIVISEGEGAEVEVSLDGLLNSND